MTLSDMAYRSGQLHFRAGVPLEKCPDFVCPGVDRSWKAGWIAAKEQRDAEDALVILAKFKRWLQAQFPNHMAVLDLKLKDKP